jgi:hypothetical protein
MGSDSIDMLCCVMKKGVYNTYTPRDNASRERRPIKELVFYGIWGKAGSS